MAKKTKPAPRKRIFPLVFWDGLRERCQAIADTEHGGNLTTFVNSTLLAAVKKAEVKPKGRK